MRFIYFMFYFVFQIKIHILRNIVDSCDKQQTGLQVMILITNVRQYLWRCRPDADSVQGTSCRQKSEKSSIITIIAIIATALSIEQ